MTQNNSPETSAHSEPIEEKKVRAETAELIARTRTHKNAARWEFMKVVVTFLGIAGPLSFATWQWASDRERARTMVVNDEMITLLKELSNPGNSFIQRSSAVALSLYGEDAVTFLIESLDYDIEELEVYDSIIYSLERISESNEPVARTTLKRLLRASIDHLELAAKETSPSDSRHVEFEHHLRAIAATANLVTSDAISIPEKITTVAGNDLTQLCRRINEVKTEAPAVNGDLQTLLKNSSWVPQICA